MLNWFYLATKRVQLSALQKDLELLDFFLVVPHLRMLKKVCKFNLGSDNEGRVQHRCISQFLGEHVVAEHGDVPMVFSFSEFDQQVMLSIFDIVDSKGIFNAVEESPHFWDILDSSFIVI